MIQKARGSQVSEKSMLLFEKLLRETTTPVQTIFEAHFASYTSMPTLRNQFFGRHQMTPSEYREQHLRSRQPLEIEDTDKTHCKQIARLLASTTMNFTQSVEYLSLYDEYSLSDIEAIFTKTYCDPDAFLRSARKQRPVALEFPGLLKCAWNDMMCLPSADADIADILSENRVNLENFNKAAQDQYSQSLGALRKAHYVPDAGLQALAAPSR